MTLGFVVAQVSVAAAERPDRLERTVPTEAVESLRGVEEVVLATNNGGKLQELRTMLANSGIRVLSLADAEARIGAKLPEVDETGATFAENARLKAQAIADRTGIPAIADDTGIGLPALKGFPGVKTKRWADEAAGREVADPERNQMLLERVRAKGIRRASVQWRTAIAMAFPGKPAQASVWEGVLNGVLAKEARGTNGFGFDPIFVVKGQRGKTLAEISSETKARFGPRGRAVRGLVRDLQRVKTGR